MDGTVKDIFNTIPDFLDEYIMSNMQSIDERINLKYLGYRRLTPEEELARNLSNDINISGYDLARSDIYPVEYIFEFAGEEIRKIIYLPYAEDGNLMYISNTRYSVTPVLTDTVISPSEDKVFLRLLKDKITIRSLPRHFILNDNIVIGQVIHGSTCRHYIDQLRDRIGKAVVSIAAYVLGKYGFYGTIKKYTNLDTNLIKVTTDKNVDTEKYNVYRSVNVKPKGLLQNTYLGHDLRILVDKSIQPDHFINNLIYGIIYIFDILPQYCNDLVNLVNSGNTKKEIFHWQVLLARLIYKNAFSLDIMIKDIKEHYNLLDSYIDSFTANKLMGTNFKVNDFYDLIVLVLSQYNNWTISYKEYNNNLLNRYIDIIYYVMYDIIISFNRVLLNLNRRANTPKDLTYKEVAKIFSTELKSKKIFSLVKSQQTNITMSSFDYTGDIKYPKSTALLTDQARGRGVYKDPNKKLPYEFKNINGYDLYIGSLLFLSKDSPSPRFKANMFFNYDLRSGRAVIPDKFKYMLKKLDYMLKGKTVNSNNAIIDITDEDDD